MTGKNKSYNSQHLLNQHHSVGLLLKPPNGPPSFHLSPPAIHSSFSDLMIFQKLKTDHATLLSCLNSQKVSYSLSSSRSYINLAPAYLSDLISNHLPYCSQGPFCSSNLPSRFPFYLLFPLSETLTLQMCTWLDPCLHLS